MCQFFFVSTKERQDEREKYKIFCVLDRNKKLKDEIGMKAVRWVNLKSRGENLKKKL